jgi:hypothetical protein
MSHGKILQQFSCSVSVSVQCFGLILTKDEKNPLFSWKRKSFDDFFCSFIFHSQTFSKKKKTWKTKQPEGENREAYRLSWRFCVVYWKIYHSCQQLEEKSSSPDLSASQHSLRLHQLGEGLK